MVGVPEFEVEVLEGLAPLASAELAGSGVRVLAERPDGLLVQAPAGPGMLAGLRLATAVYRRLVFDVPRPRALLGDAQFRALAGAMREVIASGGAFRGFRLAAAGSDSPVFRRLAAALAAATGVAFDAVEGELLVRVRKARTGNGWEVLLRLTPRPLSARTWRVCNRPGGLNATLAVAMNRVAGVAAGDRYLNLMCGSGTLLVERFLDGPARALVGLDADAEALACARANLEAAGALEACRLLHADALAAPLEGGAFDVITADLPWGDAVGSHERNRELHPAVLAAAARLAAPGARLVLLTHELRLFRAVLERERRWRLERELKVAHGGHFPHAYLLRLP
ncbi:MAG: methyltransferase domain-containing protein [Deinococcales bacterium]